MSPSTLSPELALIDPELRLQAVADLPELAPFDFLDLGDRRPSPVDFDELWLLATDDDEAASYSSPRSLPLTAAFYFAFALTRVLVIDGFVFLAVAAAVVLLNAF